MPVITPLHVLNCRIRLREEDLLVVQYATEVPEYCADCKLNACSNAQVRNVKTESQSS